jgi:hypothetical protein
MSAVKLVTVFAENKLGQMARITQVLAEAQINIRCVTVATTEKFGVIKFLVDQCDLACQSLKSRGFTVSLNEVLAVEVEDKPGGLHAVAEALTRKGINVENASGFVASRRAVVLIEVRDAASACRILEPDGLHLLTQDELLRL